MMKYALCTFGRPGDGINVNDVSFVFFLQEKFAKYLRSNLLYKELL